MEATVVNASIIVATTGGTIGAILWLLKFMLERSVRQIDERLHDLSLRLDRSGDRIQEIAERVAVLAETASTFRRDLNAAHNKIREREK